MTDVRVEITIRRPRSEVAAFMFDPAHETKWTAALQESRPRQRGRLREGSRVERRVSFFGRSFAYEYEVIAANGDELVEMVVDRPFPMRIRYELAPADGGTLARIHATGDTTGFVFRFARPLVDLMVRRNIRNDLDTLRELLESRNLR